MKQARNSINKREGRQVSGVGGFQGRISEKLNHFFFFCQWRLLVTMDERRFPLSAGVSKKRKRKIELARLTAWSEGFLFLMKNQNNTGMR